MGAKTLKKKLKAARREEGKKGKKRNYVNHWKKGGNPSDEKHPSKKQRKALQYKHKVRQGE